MNTKYTFLILITSFFIGSSLLAQNIKLSIDLIPKGLKDNVDAVVRLNKKELKIKSINNLYIKNHRITTVFNKNGIQKALSYAHYSNNAKILSLSAIIYDAYGNKIQKFSKSDFKDFSAISGGTLYSDHRIKILSYIPITYPYTISFKSEIKTNRTSTIPSWDPISSYNLSVEKSDYTIFNHTDIPILKKHKNLDSLKYKQEIKDNYIHYSANNIPGIIHEQSAIGLDKIKPHILFSLTDFQVDKIKGHYSNWHEFGEWVNNKLLFGRDKLSKETILEIEELILNVDDKTEKAKLIYQYMQNKMRYISVQVGIGGIQPIPAEEVDKLAYGDCKGLTNYTKALLDIAGIESYYSIVEAGNTKVSFEKDFASLTQGNHIILNIPNGEEDIWLECTSQTIPFGFLGDFTDDRDVLVVRPEGGIIKHTPKYLYKDNYQNTKANIFLDAKGNILSKVNIRSKNIQYHDRYHLDTDSKKEVHKHYKSRYWNYNNNLNIEEYSFINDKDKVTFEEDLKVSISDYATIQKDKMSFRINVFNLHKHLPKRYRNRKLDFEIRSGFSDEEDYILHIPDNYTVLNSNLDKIIESEFGTYKISIHKTEDNTIHYKRSLILKANIYPK